MRKICWIVVLSVAIVACRESGMELFQGKNYLYFKNRFTEDSVEISFYFYPGERELRVPMHLMVSGDLVPGDRPFLVEIDPIGSTAGQEDFCLSEMVWPARAVVDTVHEVRLFYSPKLDTMSVRLVLQVVGNAYFEPGEVAHRKMIVHFSALKSSPLWWNQKITDHYLGAYTVTKFEMFMKVTGVRDLTGKNESVLRSLALQFKYFLLEEAERGNVISDENGPLYKTVPVEG